VLVRNVSPIGILVPKRWYDVLLQFSPSNNRFSQGLSTNAKPEGKNSELLKIQIAGVEAPPFTRDSYNPCKFLSSLADERALVSFQLLGREVPLLRNSSTSDGKRQLSSVLQELDDRDSNGNNKIDEVSRIVQSSAYNEQQVAVCRLSYRPNRWQIFSTDIAEALVKAGNANVASTVLQSSTSAAGDNNSVTTKIIDSSQRIQDLRKDVAYIDRLVRTEFEAAKQSVGMWSVPEVRDLKTEVLEEVEFQQKANIFQKIWRRMRGG
jgi:endonuclease YncB( thermonuclease family)